MLFDGSDVGVKGNVGAVHLLDNDTLLFSIRAAASLPGVGSVDDSDIVRFDATAWGNTTTGSLSLYFDGSDVGLEKSSEDIDALSITGDNRLLISTSGSANVPGVSSTPDEDILVFTPGSLGSDTAGTWDLYFDGSDVAFNISSEDIIGLSLTDKGDLYFTTIGDFDIEGLTGNDEDVFSCVPTSLGSSTACTFAAGLYFDGSVFGLDGDDLDAISLVSWPIQPTPTPDSTLSGTPTPLATDTSTPSPSSTPTPTPHAPPTDTPTPSNTPTGAVTPTLTNTPLPTN